MPDINLENAGNIFLGVSVYAGMVLAAFWLAMVIWAYRDMRARSRDGLAQLVVAVVVAVLNVPGLIIYLLLRPRETMAEAYERSLEEEALLQEIEEKPTCPGCKQRVREAWQVCPACHTRLKKGCTRCNKMLELSWTLCPYCATPQNSYGHERASGHAQARPASMPEQWIASYEAQPALEYIDGDDV
jgi:RNA polymerase subunit RPABC4/transcription elongation factor Spt4